MYCPLGVEDLQRNEELQQDEIKKLQHQLDTEKVLTKEAVIKLSQVMERQNQKG